MVREQPLELLTGLLTAAIGMMQLRRWIATALECQMRSPNKS
jgi:hypothetical protein